MIPYTLKFNYIGEWARQQGLFKLRVTGVAYGFRGLIKSYSVFCQKVAKVEHTICDCN